MLSRYVRATRAVDSLLKRSLKDRANEEIAQKIDGRRQDEHELARCDMCSR